MRRRVLWSKRTDVSDKLLLQIMDATGSSETFTHTRLTTPAHIPKNSYLNSHPCEYPKCHYNTFIGTAGSTSNVTHPSQVPLLNTTNVTTYFHRQRCEYLTREYTTFIDTAVSTSNVTTLYLARANLGVGLALTSKFVKQFSIWNTDRNDRQTGRFLNARYLNHFIRINKFIQDSAA